MELIDVKEEELEAIYRSMQQNFCDDEIRTFPDFKREFSLEKYRLVHIVEGGQRLGYMGIWLLSDVTYIEHFVVYEKFRSTGIGSSALTECKRLYPSIVLEAEPPEDADKVRRINFYKRNGFYVNDDIDYLQPPYKAGSNSVKLYLLTYPAAIDNANKLISEIYQNVYGRQKL